MPNLGDQISAYHLLQGTMWWSVLVTVTDLMTAARLFSDKTLPGDARWGVYQAMKVARRTMREEQRS